MPHPARTPGFPLRLAEFERAAVGASVAVARIGVPQPPSGPATRVSPPGPISARPPETQVRGGPPWRVVTADGTAHPFDPDTPDGLRRAAHLLLGLP
jgi:hypothetical protein